jgi:NADPH:quinone reductase-like Zn-dependent oxidoreductase
VTHPPPPTMTAAVLTAHGGPEVLVVRHDVPVGVPGPGQVLVRVTAAAVNNTDIWTREGSYGLPGRPEALAGGRGPLDFPRIQGGDVAGRIVTVGPGVDPSRQGQRVIVDPALYDGPGGGARPVGALGSEADGGFAQYTVVAADRAHDMSGSPLSDEQLACLPIAYGTANGMLSRAGVRGGETVVVTGASGGVGLAAVQLAAARGARVVAVSSGAKAAAVRDAGADVVNDRAAGRLAEDLGGAAPSGVDVVVDVVAGPLLGLLLDFLDEGGRYVVAGAMAGPVVELDLRRLYLHNRVLVGSTMHTPQIFADLVARARSGELAPRVAGRFPLTAISEAQREFLRRRHVGKILVIPD